MRHCRDDRTSARAALDEAAACRFAKRRINGVDVEAEIVCHVALRGEQVSRTKDSGEDRVLDLVSDGQLDFPPNPGEVRPPALRVGHAMRTAGTRASARGGLRVRHAVHPTPAATRHVLTTPVHRADLSRSQ